MAKALVLWADDASANLGVRALADGAAALLRQALGDDTEIDLASFDSVNYLSVRSILRDIGRAHGPIKSPLARYDVVLDMGMGDSFADIYGLKRFATICYSQHAAASAGPVLVFGPQTVGPFESSIGRVLARWALSKPQLVTVRDHESAHAATQLGREPSVIASDVVFAIEPGRPKDLRDVVVNPSGLLWDPNRHVDNEKYRAAVSELIERLLQRGRKITLLPHVLDNPFPDNDARVVRDLEARYSGAVEAVTPNSLSDAREILAGANVVVAARMHACLNAISSGTPAVAWAYSRKFDPLLRQLGWEHVVDLRVEPDPVGQTLRTLDVFSHKAPDVAGVANEARRRLTLVADRISEIGSSSTVRPSDAKRGARE